jgi:hypothetical protein
MKGGREERTDDSPPDADSALELVHAEELLESMGSDLAVVGQEHHLFVAEQSQ